jgi:DNA-binding transcriptional LysR family regulator
LRFGNLRVSKSIADIEHAIGVRLLDRSFHGVEPTDAGHAVLRAGLGAFDELFGRASGKSSECAGRINAARHQPDVSKMLPNAVQRLCFMGETWAR